MNSKKGVAIDQCTEKSGKEVEIMHFPALAIATNLM